MCPSILEISLRMSPGSSTLLYGQPTVSQLAIIAECLSMRHIILRGRWGLYISARYIYLYIFVYICPDLPEITDPGNYNDYAITYHIM